jgi:hypothetical protein
VLSRVDRIQVVTGDRREAAGCWRRLFDAEVVREDRVALLAAERTLLRLGASEVELLEPDGVGAAARALGHSGPGLFAAGVATPDPDALAAHLRRLGRPFEGEGGRLFLTPDACRVPGLQLVVSRDEPRAAAGSLRSLYEVTSLVEDAPEHARRAAESLGLDPGRFVPIRSDLYGYEGVLALFAADRLDRLEIVMPFDPAKTMGRFFRRRGPRLYMAYAEADDLAPLRARLEALAPGQWTGPREGPAPDNLYVHPAALGGVLLGVSRTSHAWIWSGQPERAVPQAPAPSA